MAHYIDNTPCSYFGPDCEPFLRAIGWLEAGILYETGPVAPAFVERLATLLVDPWIPWVCGGSHRCGLCRLTGGPGSIRIGGTEVGIGNTNLFVPSAGFAYVAPSTVLHYMDAHQYSPPAAFVEAVRACPDMRSMDYLRRMSRECPELVKRSAAHGQH